MAAVINTNYLSLVAQGNLNKSQSALGSAIERLSSGMRINSAKDDAAGQAIANRFTANVKGLTQAARNANDGISISQTTEGALNEINNNLQRVRELTNQAVTGTNSSSDLKSIQDEIQQRLDEIDRVSAQTQFNGVKVLAGDNTLKIQVGANDNETISINLKKIDAKSLGLSGFNVDGKGAIENRAATADDLTAANGVTKAANGDLILKEDNTKLTSTNVLGGLKNGTTVTVQTGKAEDAAAALGWGANAEVGSFKADGKGNFSYTATKVDSAAMQGQLDKMTANGTVAGTWTNKAGTSVDIQITKDGDILDTAGNQLYQTAAGELTANKADAGTEAATTATLSDHAVAAGAGDATLKIGDVEFTSGGTDVTVSGLSATSADVVGVTTAGAPATLTIASGGLVGMGALTIDATTVKDAAGDEVYVNKAGEYSTNDKTDHKLYAHDNGKVTDAKANQYFVDAEGKLTTEAKTATDRTVDPLKALDDALAKVDSLRSELGAVQNRFESTISNLNNTVNNLSAARSRIEDADYATEVSNMTRAQILQQAGTSVLAQANQVPQTVLSLLR